MIPTIQDCSPRCLRTPLHPQAVFGGPPWDPGSLSTLKYDSWLLCLPLPQPDDSGAPVGSTQACLQGFYDDYFQRFASRDEPGLRYDFISVTQV